MSHCRLSHKYFRVLIGNHEMKQVTCSERNTIFFDENQMLSQSAQKVRPILTDRQNSLNQFLAIGIDLKIQQHF